MAKQPAERFATPAEAAAALAPIARGDLPAAAAPAFEIVEAEPPSPAANFRFEPEHVPAAPAKWRKSSKKKARLLRAKRRKLIGAVIGVIVLGLLIGSTVKLIRKFRPADTGRERRSRVESSTGSRAATEVRPGGRSCSQAATPDSLRAAIARAVGAGLPAGEGAFGGTGCEGRHGFRPARSFHPRYGAA